MIKRLACIYGETQQSTILAKYMKEESLKFAFLDAREFGSASIGVAMVFGATHRSEDCQSFLLL